MGPTILSLVERSSLYRRSNNTLKYQHGVETSVFCREAVPISEVPLYYAKGPKTLVLGQSFNDVDDIRWSRHNSLHSLTSRVLCWVSNSVVNPRHACAARVTVVVVCVCLLPNISLHEPCSTNNITYSALDKSRKICGVFSETAAFQKYLTPTRTLALRTFEAPEVANAGCVQTLACYLVVQLATLCDLVGARDHESVQARPSPSFRSTTRACTYVRTFPIHPLYAICSRM